MCHARLHRRHQSFRTTTHDCSSTRGKKLGVRGRFIRIRHDDEDWGTFSALASSFGHSVSLLLLHSLASSSEYNVFLLSVPALPGGTMCELWVLDPNKRLCLGKVGAAKFCSKECEGKKKLLWNCMSAFQVLSKGGWCLHSSF